MKNKFFSAITKNPIYTQIVLNRAVLVQQFRLWKVILKAHYVD